MSTTPKVSEKTKVAAVQMCSSHLVSDNLATAGKFIQEAAENGAKLVILPEMFAVVGQTAAAKVDVMEPLGQGVIQDFLSETSRKNKIWIVGGTIPIACANQKKAKAASLVFDEKGNRVARYDKIHMFDAVISEQEIYKESEIIEAGGEVVVVDTPAGKLGLAVCYDIRFPELFRCLAKKGAEIISLPAAFTVRTGEAHWELLTRTRAVENFCYVIGACQGGNHSKGRKTYGNSLIIEPWGTVLAKKENIEPGVIYATIDLEHLRQVRKSMPVAEHQKILCDAGNLN